MIPPLSITIRPIRGGRFEACVEDLSGEESLKPRPSDSWSFCTNSFSLERKTFDKAARAMARLVGQNAERLVYRALIKAHGDAQEVCVETKTK